MGSRRRELAMHQVHVVDDDNRDLYEEDLDQHFRLRRDVFIGERQWRALIDRGGREIDQFDGPSAVYLLGIEPELGLSAARAFCRPSGRRSSAPSLRT
jgi:N-acyl-L-homoserine lactone synthetase